MLVSCPQAPTWAGPQTLRPSLGPPAPAGLRSRAAFTPGPCLSDRARNARNPAWGAGLAASLTPGPRASSRKMKKLIRYLKLRRQRPPAPEEGVKKKQRYEVDYNLEPFAGLTPEYMEMSTWGLGRAWEGGGASRQPRPGTAQVDSSRHRGASIQRPKPWPGLREVGAGHAWGRWAWESGPSSAPRGLGHFRPWALSSVQAVGRPAPACAWKRRALGPAPALFCSHWDETQAEVSTIR